MKFKRAILTTCVVAIATCTIEPGLVRSVAPAGVGRVLGDPLSLLDRRSPGMRDDGTTVDTKARRHSGGSVAGSVTGSAPGGGAAASPPRRGPPVIGGDGTGPLALADNLPGVPGFAGGGGWGDPGVGAVNGPGGGGTGIPGVAGGGGAGGGGGGGAGAGGGGDGGQPGLPPDDTPPCCNNGGGGGPIPTQPPSASNPSTPAPEPAAWLMLITGFWMTGAAMRGSRRSIAKAAR